MPELVRMTQTIDPNEKAWSFAETTRQSPGSRGFHRYELISVKRDGDLAIHERDLGKASLFKGAKKAIMIPSFFEHSVAELRDIADNVRWDTVIDIKDRLQLEIGLIEKNI